VPHHQPATLYRNLRALLARRRRQLGLSQLAFDELMGLAPGYTSKIEAQMRTPNAELLVECFEALGMQLIVFPLPRWRPPAKLQSLAGEGGRARDRKRPGRRCALPDSMIGA